MLQLKSASRILAFCACIVAAVPLSAFAESFELQAISDFFDIQSGEVPYYKDLAGGRDVLAINAAKEDYREKFARADHDFRGPDGLYDITISALGEIDGDGVYRLLVNGIVQGVAVNTPVTTDYTIIEHMFSGISLLTGSIVSVESSAVSNDQIPEGDGYAFARGRWRTLTISAQDTSNLSRANLGIAIATSSRDKIVGSDITVLVTVFNNANDSVATTPSLRFELPNDIRFVSGESCGTSIGGIECTLSEIPPGDNQTVSITVQASAQGLQNLIATVTADQAESDLTDNSASLALNVMAMPAIEVAEIEETEEVVVTETAESTEIVNIDVANETNDLGEASAATPIATTDSGGLSPLGIVLALLTVLVFRMHGRLVQDRLPCA